MKKKIKSTLLKYKILLLVLLFVIPLTSFAGYSFMKKQTEEKETKLLLQEQQTVLEKQEKEIKALKQKNQQEEEAKIKKAEEEKKQEEEQIRLAQIQAEQENKNNCLNRKKEYEDRLSDLKKKRNRAEELGEEFEESAKESYEHDKKNLEKRYSNVLEGECLKYF